MRVWKLLSIFFLGLLPLLYFGSVVKADGQFTVDATVNYTVEDSGKTLINYDITLENNFSTLYATAYTLTLENIDVKNVAATNASGTPIVVDVQKNAEKTDIKLTFTDPVVGKGSKRHFYITYENSSFAIRTGEIWEISIPKLSENNNFRNYTVNVFIPQSFGLEAYVSPKPQTFTQNDKGKNYVFSKLDVLRNGITAGFGQFQVFSFNLSYHLENPLAVTTQTQIALPPDTAFQKMYYSKISPEPETITLDPDGNWLATYKLAPRQRLDVVAAGSVQIFASYRSFPIPDNEVLSNNLRSSDFWQVDDPQIKALASELKTPEAIYKYVSTTLKYSFDRVTPNVSRLGAKGALENPNQAICMEFTDLFIAIARAAGIPAREVNGYAYTENPELQPLSLVADVLHSWPEYYDKNAKAWIPIDPTWASTSGGIDYFNKLDLRHFAFVIHGENAIKPYAPGSYKLGPNPQKDVFVSFGKLPEVRINNLKLTASQKNTFPFTDSIYTVTIENPGPTALYSVYPAIFFDGKERRRDFIEVLTPFSKYQFDIKVPFSLLGRETPDEIKVVVLGSEIKMSTNKTQVVLGSLISIFIIFALVILIVLVKLRKITFNRLFAKIRSINAKFAAKFTKNPSGS